ncbi:MAG: sulfatase-like hydrolase/transferase [Pseudomonadales bacterium]|nr:sulfatase-like hydrolase/transferase [Pseudomonadales bacterium]MBO6597244.1 sulfatase-like hydrolase/transferase [Pseudomonadales bacterium]MBO6655250.1 sulfatase-like hydrolase/transferase [Pseudomonadales bacterium]MBO6703873.1 sulfatase-like hydrolase/transferase [Pseudomonadales bacterium]MBO6823570.1 sulfatase-like hydrolase/transferase [Pseudomonadales bacterium]
MKKTLFLFVVTAAAGGWLFSQYWYFLPGVIQGFLDPIGEFQEVTWERGPEVREIDKPNVLLILVDDLGFNDLTFYGGGIAGGSVPTPNIDSIASEGVHFSNAYAGNGTCAPSRAALLTGRFATRSGFEFTPANPQLMKFVGGDRFIEENAEGYPSVNDLGLPATELTIAELLKPEGYHSVVLGKWHLGGSEGSSPIDQGFDEFLGFLPGGAKFMRESDPNVVNSKQAFDRIDKFSWANFSYAVRYNKGPRFEPDSHMTDYFSREAVNVIEANKHRPFFIYLAYNAPHTPLQSEKSDYEALSHIDNHIERTYAGMIRGLDRGIGQVLQALEDHGVADNTIVIFTSDHGGAHYVGLSDLNKPYRGWKMTFFEGGIRVPYFIRWGNKLPVDSQYDSAVAHVDILPTLVAAAGAQLPDDRDIDGVDLLSYMLSEPQLVLERPLFWRTGGYKVVQLNGWKLQLLEQNGKTWLFNLNEDPTEQTDLSEAMPEKLAELTDVLYAMDNQMLEPLWPPLVQSEIPVDLTLLDKRDDSHETIIWTN